MSVAKIKKAFFNQTLIGTFLDKKTFRVLNRFGATVRKTAQFSMRNKKGPSKPGTPPNAHVKTLKRLLFYSLDKESKKVIIGPVKISSSQKVSIPNLHEYGGTISRLNKGKKETVRYPARPYMRPAFSATTPKVATWYKN